MLQLLLAYLKKKKNLLAYLLLTYLLTYLHCLYPHWAAVWSTRITPVPLLLTGAFDTIRQGGPTRTSADVSVPRFAGFSLIT